MAKKAEAVETVVDEPAVDQRVRFVEVPVATLTHPVTVDEFQAALAGERKTVKRVDFIKELALTGFYTRSQILALVRLAAGDDSIKYQIIFQATKGLDVEWPKAVKASPEDTDDEDAEDAEDDDEDTDEQ